MRLARCVAESDLEEKTLDQIGDRCEECGAKLTPQEIQAAMESGGPALCSIHAAEVVPLGDDELGSVDSPSRPSGLISAQPISSTILPSLPPAAKRS